MNPRQAREFYEEDEDPNEVFAAFDSSPHGLTGQAPPVAAVQVVTTDRFVSYFSVNSSALQPGDPAQWPRECVQA
ncbi:hypothetical protein ABZ832_22090 [Streptantibioticus parmotrematis]|uniref:hypothetical protein n=1 Tax=Streptantibioticus parmotrematis TaxID=2873249 RepID=UPI0033F742F9